MAWTPDQIKRTLSKLYRAKTDLSYNAMTRKHQPLVSAAAYHFGSYRRAVELAGIDYASIMRRPRWTRIVIIGVLKKAKRAGDDLSWSSVTKRRDELGRAAFASLQPRLFGTWDRALHAAGLDADEINRYRKWTRDSIVFDLKHLAADGESLASGDLQKEDPGLHAAALRRFGSYSAALRAAKIDPIRVQRRRSWDRASIIAALASLRRKTRDLDEAAVRSADIGLYRAAVRVFGTFAKARAASKKR